MSVGACVCIKGTSNMYHDMSTKKISNFGAVLFQWLLLTEYQPCTALVLLTKSLWIFPIDYRKITKNNHCD